MKQFIIFIGICCFALSCKPKQVLQETAKEETTTETPKSELKYDDEGIPIYLEYSPKMIDLGEVIHGDKRELEFDYVNVTEEEVVIEVVTACSCTETDYTKGTMQPGEGGKIKLIFDSTSKKESEVIDVDIILKNTDPATGYPVVDRVNFKYDLVFTEADPATSPDGK